MQKTGNKNIEEATQRVRERMPLEKIRQIPKYKNISPEAYEELIKNAETIALLVLRVFISKK